MTLQLDGLTLGGTITMAASSKFNRMVVGTGTPGYATSAGTCYITGVCEVDGDLYADGDIYAHAGCIVDMQDNNAAALNFQESSNVYLRFITTDAGEKLQVHKDLDLGLSGTSGKLSIFPSTAAKGHLAITVADATGDTATTVNVAEQAAARTYTIPDHGGAASFVLGVGDATGDGMFKNPEADTEAGFITYNLGGTDYQVPFYASS